jgi:TPR repeat protein
MLMTGLGLLAILIGVVSVRAYFRNRNRAVRLMKALSSTHDAAYRSGMVAVQGETSCDHILTSPMGNDNCYGYRYEINASWSTREGEKTVKGSERIDQGEEHVRFTLDDGSGAVTVDLPPFSEGDGQVDQKRTEHKANLVGDEARLPNGRIPVGRYMNRGETLEVVATEWVRPHHNRLFVYGEIRGGDGVVRAPANRSEAMIVTPKAREAVIPSAQSARGALHFGLGAMGAGLVATVLGVLLYLPLWRVSWRCHKGDAAACIAEADLYYTGKGIVTQDTNQAWDLREHACWLGSLPTCSDVADAYANGTDDLDEDDDKAAMMYQHACDLGYLPACVDLGWAYAGNESFVDEDDKKAIKLYERACNGGDQFGCTDLGYAYEQGDGVDEDDAKAAGYYQGACNGGNPLGCADLGELYLEGKGVHRSHKQGLALLSQSCTAGSGWGCHCLGDAYAQGDGVTQDTDKANDFYKQACTNGYQDDCPTSDDDDDSDQ